MLKNTVFRNLEDTIVGNLKNGTENDAYNLLNCSNDEDYQYMNSLVEKAFSKDIENLIISLEKNKVL